jgi:glycosyltransferase involved in cell wall biosynthesis
MNLVLVSPLYRKDDYVVVQKKYNITNPGQKFYQLLYDGLKKNNVSVTAVSVVPDRYSDCINESDDFHYLFYNKKNAGAFLKTSFELAKNYISEDSIIIADGEAYWTLRLALRFRKNKVINLITDFPHHVASYSTKMANKPKLYRSLYNIYAMHKLVYFRKADAFILLTAQMTDEVGEKKPWIVIEGFTDSSLTPCERPVSDKEEISIAYLGALNGKSGIMNLISAVNTMLDVRIAVDIYGGGNLADEIKKEKNTRIRYHGILPLEKVMQVEREADFLINPRPSNEEFNKYSFPSKILEYMSSGTPVITTRLAGIPDEYEPYLFYIDDDSPERMAKCLREILASPKESVSLKAAAAQKFALREKNNTIQAKKIIGFISLVINRG